MEPGEILLRCPCGTGVTTVYPGEDGLMVGPTDYRFKRSPKGGLIVTWPRMDKGHVVEFPDDDDGRWGVLCRKCDTGYLVSTGELERHYRSAIERGRRELVLDAELGVREAP